MDIQSRFRNPEWSFAAATAEEIDADLLEELTEEEGLDLLEDSDALTPELLRMHSLEQSEFLPELELESDEELELQRRPDLDALEAALLDQGALFQEATLPSGLSTEEVLSVGRALGSPSGPIGRRH